MKITVKTESGQVLGFDLSCIKNMTVFARCIEKLTKEIDIEENDFLGLWHGEVKNYKVIQKFYH